MGWAREGREMLFVKERRVEMKVSVLVQRWPVVKSPLLVAWLPSHLVARFLAVQPPSV